MSRLDAAKRGANETWSARCPAHEDGSPSLSVRAGDHGGVIVKCHAGCTFEAICAALEFEPGQLCADQVTGAQPPRAAAPAAAKAGSKRCVHSTDVEAELAALAAVRKAKSPSWVLTHRHQYFDRDRVERMRMLRFEPPGGGDKTLRPIHPCDGGWALGDAAGLLPLYRHNELRLDERIFVVEGEKAADAGAEIGLNVTTSAHGASSAAKSDWRPIAGCEVLVLPDNDKPGDKYASDVCKSLAALDARATARIVTLPELPEHGDIVEFIAARRAAGESNADIVAEVQQLAAAADLVDGASDAKSSEGEPRKSVASKLVSLAMELEAELFCDRRGVAMATIRVGEHKETHRVKDRQFRHWLGRSYYSRAGATASKAAIDDALNTFEGLANFDAEPRDVYVRVANLGDVIYIDLGQPDWSVVKVTANGWSIEKHSPAKFRRSAASSALPAPVKGGNLAQLRPFLNVDDTSWPLVLGWLVAALRGKGPYPLLALLSLHGSAKSTTMRYLRRLVDPNACLLRSEPRELRDLAVSAEQSWVVALDNLSHVPAWLSDALCRLSTGGGLGARALYTDGDEVIFDLQRPAVLSAIEDVIQKADLLDRALVCNAPPIPKSQRLPESVLDARFELAAPQILGALLDAVALGLRCVNDIKFTELPRLADFALWVQACEPAFGCAPGLFMQAYARNRDDASLIALELSPVAQALIELVQRRSEDFSLTATQLLAELKSVLPSDDGLPDGWPRSAAKLSGQLKRLIPNLFEIGIQVSFDRAPDRGRARQIEVRRVGGRTTADDTGAASDDTFDDPAPASDDTDASDDSSRTLLSRGGGAPFGGSRDPLTPLLVAENGVGGSQRRRDIAPSIVRSGRSVVHPSSASGAPNGASKEPTPQDSVPADLSSDASVSSDDQWGEQ